MAPCYRAKFVQGKSLGGRRSTQLNLEKTATTGASQAEGNEKRIRSLMEYFCFPSWGLARAFGKKKCYVAKVGWLDDLRRLGGKRIGARAWHCISYIGRYLGPM